MTIKNTSKIKFQYTLLVLVLMFLYNNIFSQTDSIRQSSIQFDTIKFVNGSKQAAKIIEISAKDVKYKNPRDTLGPTFSVRRSEVAGFVLKNGCIPMEQQGYVNCVKDPAFDIVKEKEFTRKIVSIDMFQLINMHFQMNIDLIFKKRKSGIGLFINEGLSEESDKDTYRRLETKSVSGGYYKKRYFGLDYKLFPFAHKKFTYFYSFGFDIGIAYINESTTVEVTDSYGRKASYTKKVFTEAKYYGYRFNNGIIYRINKNFVCQGLFAIGINQYSVDDKPKNVNTFFPKLTGSVLLGYAF